MAVVDASAVVDLLVNGQPLPDAAVLASPAHLDAEVLSALGRLHRHGVLSGFGVEEMLDDLADTVRRAVPIEDLTSMAFGFAATSRVRDGLYVALAQVSMRR